MPLNEMMTRATYAANMVGMRLMSSTTGGDGTSVDISADTGAVATLATGLLPALRVLLGVIVWVTTIGIVVYTAFEVMYIVFPFMHNAISGEGGEKRGKGLDKAVSGDARRAVEMGDRGEGNPLVYYLKSRVVVYIVLGMMVVILLSGSALKLMDLGAFLGSGVTNSLDEMSTDGAISNQMTQYAPP